MQTRRSRGCLMRLWRLAEGNGFTRLCAGQIAFSLRLMFSFACQKRTRKAPATFEAREARIKGYSPLIIPEELSKSENASRFAKRIFCTSPVYGSADGVTLQQDFTFCKGVKSAAKQQIGETRKKR